MGPLESGQRVIDDDADWHPQTDKNPLSFIRTMTVGPGITPDLLTFDPTHLDGVEALAGFCVATVTAGGDFHPALITSATCATSTNDKKRSS
jgi:hypothetical protein